MIVSELIAQLQMVLRTAGDLPVYVNDDGCVLPLASCPVCPDDNEAERRVECRAWVSLPTWSEG